MSLVEVVGNLARDRVDGGPPRPGGCPIFAGAAFRLLGRDGRILTRHAEHDRDLFAEVVAGLGVPVTILDAERTSGFDHHYAGEVRTSTITALGDPWTPSAAAHLDDDVGWVHVAPLARSDFPPETLAVLAGGGRRLSLDGQGLVRAPRVGPLTEDADFDPALLDHVSVLKLSEEEATVVAGGPFDARDARALGVPEIVVTLGSRGQVLWLDGEPEAVPTTPVLDVEATGAGDAFMVGYAVARNDGASPQAAARAASELVTRMLLERGGRQ